MRPIAILLLIGLTVAACGRDPAPSSGQMVTARASAVIDALRSLTPPPSASASVQWHRVSEIRDFASSGPFGAVGFDRGYVAEDESRTIGLSTDGVTWRRVALPLPLKGGVVVSVHSVTTDGRRVVVVGGYSPCSYFSWEMDPAPAQCRMRPVSWASDDGRTWRSSGRWTGPVGPAEFFGSTFSMTWQVPNGGWDAAQTFFASNESDGDGQALWHSEDGVKWSLFRGGPADPRFAWALADGQGHRVAYEQQTESATECDGSSPNPVWTSSDGRKYQRLNAFPFACDELISGALAPAGVGPWVFLGALGISATDRQPATWASHDLTAWTRSVLPVPADVRDVAVSVFAHGARGYVATGVSSEGGHSITWVSDDGTSWRVAETRRAIELGDFVFSIADGPAGMLGFGCGDPVCEGTSTAVWRLEDLR